MNETWSSTLTKEERKFFTRTGVGVKLNKKINPEKVPAHIAFIMDGNGRWAIRRNLARSVGHKYGYGRMLMVVKRCSDYGVKVCSLFAFSTENWRRPKEEVDDIFRLIRENMHRDLSEFMKWNVRVKTMGDLTRFPQDLQDKLAEIIEQTKSNTGMVLNLCANYGGRADIVRAANMCAGLPKGEPISEADFAKCLYGADLPDPDLIVRTSGEQRVSNFMLWQMAYSELLFIKPLWPDLTPRTVDRCLLEYQKRKRRFGKV